MHPTSGRTVDRYREGKRGGERPSAPGATGLWLHAVVPEGQPGRWPHLTGLAGAAPRLVRAAGLVAVASPVPLDEYGEEPLRRNLENLTWLERTARAHHEVVVALAGTGPVVPVGLATVYRDAERITELLDERRAQLTAVLEQVTGRREWGVKAYLDQSAAGARPAAGAGAVDGDAVAALAGGAGAGAAYLRRRRAQLTARDQERDAAARSATEVHRVLREYAVDARLHQPQDRRLSGSAAPMVFNGAYLIAEERSNGFVKLVDRLQQGHPALRLRLTGPWPPYSFAGKEQP